MSSAALTPASPLELRAFGATDIGRRREHNEDAVLVRPDLQLWAVADGAGGHNAGNVASAIATASLANHFEATEKEARLAVELDPYGMPNGARRLVLAIQRANRDVIEIAKTSKKHRGMGSTVVAIAASRAAPVLHVAHVGDSRCYRMRAGVLEQLTVDHSLLQDVLETRPDLPPEALAKLPMKVVTRALGMEAHVRVSVRSYEALPGDKYLLCSDGITLELGHDELRRVLGESAPPEALARALIDAANRAGGRDNVAAIVVECMAVSRPAAAVKPANPPRERATASSPEILVLGIETEANVTDAGERLHVVPADSASESLLDALEHIIGPRRTQRLAPPTRCSSCDLMIEGESSYCPHCGARQEQ